MSSPDSSTKAPEKGDTSDLAGRRILLVEDSPVVAPFTADLLTEIGCKVVGPAPNMATARELVETGDFDGALMDVHIRGERVFPLCEMLESRGVPFVLTSGYADWTMPEKWRRRPRLQKPYTVDQIEQALSEAFAES
jgi:CheY-like chemotaxis protein